MSAWGLSEKTIKTVQGILQKYPMVHRALLYGSRAKGNYKKGSDIDITLYGDEALTQSILGHIAGDLEDSSIAYLVDLSIFNHLDNAKLREHIERVGVVFYERGGGGWETVALGEVCTFIRGLTYSKSDEVEFSSNIVIRATNIDLNTHKLDFSELRYIHDSVAIKEEKKLKQNDILICTASGSKSHLGKVAIVESDLGMAFGGFMGVLRANLTKISPQYLYIFLISDSFKKHIDNLSDGANINNLKFAQIESLQIPLPPLPIQQKIVAKLDAIFAEIDKATKAAEEKGSNLTLLKQSILKQAFNGELIKE